MKVTYFVLDNGHVVRANNADAALHEQLIVVNAAREGATEVTNGYP